MANTRLESESKRKVTYSISIEQGDKDTIQKICKEKGKTISNVVSKLIKKYNLKHGA